MLFADEPTGNLDTATGARVIELLFDLNSANGTTLVLVTHDRAIAGRCNRLIELDAGRLVGIDARTALRTAGAAARLAFRRARGAPRGLLVAVTALTGVGFFTDRIGQAVDQRAAEVIAADLRMRSAEPLPADYDRLAAENGIATARTVSFPSVVYFGAESALTAIRAVGPGYPLRGRIKISDAPFEAARETNGLPGRGEAWLDSRLLARLGAGIGDRVSIGAAAFKVTQVLRLPPGPGLVLRRSRAFAPDSARGPRIAPDFWVPEAARRIHCFLPESRPGFARSG